MEIYFKSKRTFKDIEELLTYGYSRYAECFKPTYDERNQYQCHPARRSFGDLLNICRTYFPKTTEKQLAKTIFSLHTSIKLRASYCNTIDKLVFLKDSGSFDVGVPSGYKNHRGNGTISYNEFIKLL